MRHEKLYLTDIVEAARAIEKFIMGEDFNEFEQNEMMNSAVLQKLAVIGEAASKLPKEFTRWINKGETYENHDHGKRRSRRLLWGTAGTTGK
ncbi:MAG: HepT-like ribonuclease domain-containing protein [Anaerolineales bacterium]